MIMIIIFTNNSDDDNDGDQCGVMFAVIGGCLLSYRCEQPVQSTVDQFFCVCVPIDGFLHSIMHS